MASHLVGENLRPSCIAIVSIFPSTYPAGVTALRRSWLLDHKREHRTPPPLARVMGVGRQQQQHPSTLDLVLTSDENIVNLLQTEAPLSKSDHSMIKIKLQTASLYPTDTKEQYMYDKGDYATLREEMDIDLENEFNPYKNVNDMW